MLIALPVLLCLLTGAALTLITIRATLQARASTYWPYTPGLVVTSDYFGHSTGSGVNFRPWISYVYEVNGRRFSNNQVKMHDSNVSGSRGSARKIVNQYPVGSPVTVFYNPDDPHEAVLEPGKTALNTLLIIAAFFIFIGVLIMFIPAN